MLNPPLVKDTDTVLRGSISQVNEYLYCVICRFCATALMLTSCSMCVSEPAQTTPEPSLDRGGGWRGAHG